MDDVNQVENELDGETTRCVLLLDLPDLLFFPIDQYDNVALAVGIAALYLVEHLTDALCLAFLDAGIDALVLWARSSGLVGVWLAVEIGQHLLGVAHLTLLLPIRSNNRHTLIVLS